MSGHHTKNERRQIRRYRIRKRVRGSAGRPRLCVFRSARYIYAQIIDDDSGTTLVAASSREPSVPKPAGSKVGVSTEVGKLVAQRAREQGIVKVAFDRGGYLYHGRVKALADAARENGLRF